MTGARIEVTFDAARLTGALNRLRFALARPEEVTEPIGLRLRDNWQDRFRTEAGPDGTPWAPLHPVYAEIKRGPGILRGPNWSRSGLNNSLNSLAYTASGWTVEIGSNKIYAAIHQFGGTIKPVRAKVLTLRTAGGAIWGAAKQVTIPARPYLGLSAEDARDVLEVVEDWQARALGPG